MEERHFLEKASWVAGIISALITLAIWVTPGDSEMLAKQGQETVLPEPTLARPEGAKRATDKRKQVEANQAKTTPPQWTCRGIANDLAQAFAAAEKINYAKNRNEAFFSLARKALCLENYEMFEKAADHIPYADRRNEIYGDAVDFTLNLRKFDLAEKYAEQIQYAGLRDAAMSRIVAKASER